MFCELSYKNFIRRVYCIIYKACFFSSASQMYGNYNIFTGTWNVFRLALFKQRSRWKMETNSACNLGAGRLRRFACPFTIPGAQENSPSNKIQEHTLSREPFGTPFPSFISPFTDGKTLNKKIGKIFFIPHRSHFYVPIEPILFSFFAIPVRTRSHFFPFFPPSLFSFRWREKSPVDVNFYQRSPCRKGRESVDRNSIIR